MAQDKVRIEVIRKVMMGNKLHNRGAVVESDDPGLVAEYNAVVSSGYARKSTKALTEGAPENKALSGAPSNKGGEFDAAAIVDGTVAEVGERLAGLTKDQLKAVTKAEKSGKDRQGVHDAIAAAAPAE